MNDEDEIDKIMERIVKNAKELNKLGWNVTVGTDEEGSTGMLEIKIRKRVIFMKKFREILLCMTCVLPFALIVYFLSHYAITASRLIK